MRQTVAIPASWRFGLAVCLLMAVTAQAAAFMAGADISSLPTHEDAGAVYRDNGQTGDAIDILADHGANYFRLRLFVNPQFQNNYNGGYDAFVAQDLDYTIALAQRIKARGGKLLLDFHYSDTWADPSHQTKPAAWNALGFSQLEQQVYDYTKQSIEAFKAAGVLPEMVQIGNEIANGMLWEDGRLWRNGVSESQEFENLASLLAKGIQGARDGAGPGDEPLVMIHHDQGSNWGATSYFLNRLLPRLEAKGADPDVLGYSYYPIYHAGGIAAVQQNLTNSVNAYGKPVVIAETGFPSRVSQFPENPPEVNLEFAISEAGQQAFLQSLVGTLQGLPNEMGMGVFWWYAEARPTTGLNVWKNGRFGLFDQDGNLNDAASVFEQFLPAPGDFNRDGVVDAADYTVWRDGLGTNYDQSDYDDWRANFGGGAGATGIAPATTRVPEPGGATALVWGLAILISAASRRDR